MRLQGTPKTVALRLVVRFCRKSAQICFICCARAQYPVIEKDSDGYFVASVPALHGCHTQAKSLDTLMKRVKEAIELCLEVEGDNIVSPEFVGVQRVEV